MECTEADTKPRACFVFLMERLKNFLCKVLWLQDRAMYASTCYKFPSETQSQPNHARKQQLFQIAARTTSTQGAGTHGNYEAMSSSWICRTWPWGHSQEGNSHLSPALLFLFQFHWLKNLCLSLFICNAAWPETCSCGQVALVQMWWGPCLDLLPPQRGKKMTGKGITSNSAGR